jgi:hypothetical protein
MRPNKFGIRGMKSVWLKGRFVYFWMPPVSLQNEIVVAKAREWNAKLDAHRGINNCTKPTLGPVIPMTVADLFRKYESSSRFTWYVPRTRQGYACFYRLVETSLIEDGSFFWELQHIRCNQGSVWLWDVEIRRNHSALPLLGTKYVGSDYLQLKSVGGTKAPEPVSGICHARTCGSAASESTMIAM